jgi:hypothetical protein
MDVAVGPTAGVRRRNHAINHTRRPADIDVRAERLISQQSVVVDRLVFTVVIHLEPVALACAQAAQEGGMLGGAHRVMQFIRCGSVPQVLELRHERRDADAAGDQDMFARDLVEAE